LVKSDIADWYDSGEYKPYAENDITQLMNVLKNYKKNIQPWVRIQRLVRDIPSSSIEAGYDKKSNLRQMIADEMKLEGTRCRCIRCMEIGDNHKLMEKAKLIVRQYEASDGIEYQISIESNEETLDFKKAHLWFLIRHFFYKIFFGIQTYWSGHLETYNGIIGFCRLRIDNNAGADIIQEIKECALIREVHVYGYSLGVGNCNNGLKSSQHKGFGKLLVKKAEEIAAIHGFKKIAVIAGVGTREYYKNKCGYSLKGTYMVKDLTNELDRQIQHELLVPLSWFMLLGIMIIWFVL
jgi:histone acetyltransferase (RNA polymerase elongator complex component)